MGATGARTRSLGAAGLGEHAVGGTGGGAAPPLGRQRPRAGDGGVAGGRGGRGGRSERRDERGEGDEQEGEDGAQGWLPVGRSIRDVGEVAAPRARRHATIGGR